MRWRLFRALLLVGLLMPSLALAASVGLPRDWGSLLWLLLGLGLLGLTMALFLSQFLTKLILKPLREARLEDFEAPGAYEELRPLAGRMLEQSRGMQKQLQRQNTELRREYEKQDRMRRDFTANISHELKTPLTSISGYAEIIRDGIAREEDIERFAGKIYSETQRLIALVSDILKLSQLDEGHQIRLERVSLDLVEVCRRVIGRLQTAAEQREIRFSLAGDTGRIVGVEQIVEEIVYNLCDNAIKYNRPGGEIFLSVCPEGEKLVLTVRDTGIGISQEEQTRVFERFYRVDKSHSKEIGGTGLGLSIVKHGALYHDARIELSSEPGEGTQFRLLFQKES